MSKIFISAGHSNKRGVDRGAAGNGFIEGEESVKIRHKVVEILKEKYDEVAVIDADDSILAQSMNFFKKLTNPDSVLIDIHFNAGSPTATGVETIVPAKPTKTELDAAKKMSDKVSEVLGIPTRGNFMNYKGVRSEAESQHKTLGWMRLTGCNILLETAFISNKSDMESYVKNFDKLCETIADVLYTTAYPWQNPPKENKPVVEGKSYTVVKGDTLYQVSKKTGVSVSRLKEINDIDSDLLRVGQILEL